MKRVMIFGVHCASVLLCAGLLLCASGVWAQVPRDPRESREPSAGDLFSALSVDQRFVRLAVDSSICLVRQEYNLIDAKGNEYGRNSDLFFGRRFGLAVIT